MKIVTLISLVFLGLCGVQANPISRSALFVAKMEECPSFISVTLDDNTDPILKCLGPLAELESAEIREGLAAYQEVVVRRAKVKESLSTLDAVYKVDILLGLVFDRVGEKTLRPFYLRDSEKAPLPKRGVGCPVEEGDDGMLRIPWRYGGNEGPPVLDPQFAAQFDYDLGHFKMRPKQIISKSIVALKIPTCIISTP